MSDSRRRAIKRGDGAEQDVHTGWRRIYCYTQRTGVTARVKRRTRRRERRELADELRRGDA